MVGEAGSVVLGKQFLDVRLALGDGNLGLRCVRHRFNSFLRRKSISKADDWQRPELLAIIVVKTNDGHL